MEFSKSLKLNHIFRRLYAAGGHGNKYLVLYARKNRLGENRVGVTVSKKLERPLSGIGCDAVCGRYIGSMKAVSCPGGTSLWWPAAVLWTQAFPI